MAISFHAPFIPILLTWSVMQPGPFILPAPAEALSSWTKASSSVNFHGSFTSPISLLSKAQNLIAKEDEHFAAGPRPVMNELEQVQGIVVQDYPVHACQKFVNELELREHLAEITFLPRLLPKDVSKTQEVKQQLSLLLDLQSTKLTSAHKDLRWLLVKELRYMLSHGGKPVKGLAGFRKEEVTARLQLTAQFLEKLGARGALYEQELMKTLETKEQKNRGQITKLFVSNIAEEVEQWMIGDTFISPQFQTLLCVVLQMNPRELSIHRRAMEATFKSHRMGVFRDRQEAIKALFQHVHSSTLFFSDSETQLILDILELAWETYHKHNVQILKALQGKEKGSTGIQWIEQQMLADQVVVTFPKIRRELDRYGFLSASYLARWVDKAQLPRVSLLLPNCRLFHVTGSGTVSLTSTGSFAVSREFNGLLGEGNFCTFCPFSVVTTAFNVHILEDLRRYAESPLKSDNMVQVVQLTPTSANKIRGVVTTQGPVTKQFEEILEKAKPVGSAPNACVGLFDGLFRGQSAELRILLNTELALMAKRARHNLKVDNASHFKKDFESWFAALEKEETATLEELKEQMAAVSANPDYIVESLFFNPHLALKVITNPVFATSGNAAAIAEMSAVQQLRFPMWVVKLDSESLRKAQHLLLSSPLHNLTFASAIERGVVSPAGKQNVLRRDLVERVAIMLQLTARLQHQFSNNLVPLLSRKIRELLQEGLCIEKGPWFSAEVRIDPAAIELREKFNRIGFVNAFNLMFFASATRMTVKLLDRHHRLIIVGTEQSKDRQINLLEDSTSGEYHRVSAGIDLMKFVQSGKTLKPWLELPGVRLAAVFAANMPTPTAPKGFLGLKAKFWKRTPEQPVEDRITEAVAAEVQFAVAKENVSTAPGPICVPTSVNFIGCITSLLLHCKSDDMRCKKTVTQAKQTFAELWERAYQELTGVAIEGSQLLKRHPWDKLSRVVRDALEVSRPYLSFAEREVLFSGFPIKGLQGSFHNMHGLHLLLMRSILFQIPQSDPGIECLRALLSAMAKPFKRECTSQMVKAFADFIASPIRDPETDLLFRRLSERAARELRKIQILDHATAEKIMPQLRSLHHMNFSTLYDFVISPLEDNVSSPTEKLLLGACLYEVGRMIESNNQMYSQSPGLVFQSGSLGLIQHCFLQVWQLSLRSSPPTSRKNTFLLGDAQRQEGNEESSWGTSASGFPKQLEGGNPTKEAFQKAVYADYFLHLMIHHRLMALIDALALFQEAMSSNVIGTIEKEAANVLVERMQSLSYENFLQFVMGSKEMVSFSFSLAAQSIKKNIFLLYFIPFSGNASFYRIGHNRRTFRGFIKRLHRKNVVCNPVCMEIQPSVDLESLKKTKVAREVSEELRHQVEAYNKVTSSISILSVTTATELSSSFQTLESIAKQGATVSPASIDLCSKSAIETRGTPLPVCAYETVPYRYLFEAFRLTLAQQGVHAHTWFLFFGMRHESLVNNCLLEARRLSFEKTLESLMEIAEWRRMLPFILSNAVKLLRSKFADFKKLLTVIEGRIQAADIAGKIRGMTNKVVKWLTGPRRRKFSLDVKPVSVKTGMQIQVQNVITLSELQNLSEDVLVQSWKKYALSLDSTHSSEMQYSRSNRLLVAIGTGFKSAQMLISNQKVFFGDLQGNKEAEETVQKLAAEYFLASGGPQEGFRGFRNELVNAIQKTCNRKKGLRGVLRSVTTCPISHGCKRNEAFCNRVVSCAEANSKARKLTLDAECTLKLIDELLTKPSTLSPEVVLKVLSGVLTKFLFSIVIWNQLTGTLIQFKQNQDMQENIPIQIIIAPRQNAEAAVSGAAGESKPQPLSSFAEQSSDEDEFYSASEDVAISATSTAAPNAVSTPQLFSDETEVFTVSPGFDLYERLLEARRAVDNEPSLPAIPHRGSYFQLEQKLLDMQKSLTKISSKSTTREVSLGGLKEMIDELSSRADLKVSSLLEKSKIFAVLGPNEENKTYFIQQKTTLENLLEDSYLSRSLLDECLFNSLTSFQLFIVCKNITDECKDFRVKFLTRARATFMKAQEEGEVKKRVGQQQRAQLLNMSLIGNALKQIEEAIEKEPHCLTDGCQQEETALLNLLKPMKKVLDAQNFHTMKKELLETKASSLNAPIPLQSFSSSSHLVFPHLPMEQWLDVLFNLRSHPQVVSAQVRISSSCILMETTCFEIARRRLKDALEILQKAVQEQSPTAAAGIAAETADRNKRQDEAVQNVLDECCRETSFQEHGATYLTHKLVEGLRQSNFIVSASSDLKSLMNNSHVFSTWIQQALNTQIQEANPTLKMMMAACSEGSFYTQGAAFCTRKLMKLIKAKKFRIDRLLSVKPTVLSQKTLTYNEWLYQSEQLHVSSPQQRGRKAFRKRLLQRQQETRVWIFIAEILYNAPATPWHVVQKKLKENRSMVEATSNLGKETAQKLYLAVQALHQTVSFVREKDFKRFGAFAVTNMLVEYLQSKGIYVAGNSAISLRSIRQAKTFSQWRQDMLVLKMSTELVKKFIPPTLIAELRRKRLSVVVFRSLAKSRLLPTIIRRLLNSTIEWAAPHLICRSVKSLTHADTTQEAGRLGSIIITVGVVASGYIKPEFGFSTRILPTITSIMESYQTRSIIEKVLYDANIPKMLGRTILNFAAEIEDKVLDLVTKNYLEPEVLNDSLMRWTGFNFNLQETNLANSFSSISLYLQHIVRFYAPVVFADLRKVIIEPLFHGFVTYLQELVNSVLSVGAKEAPKQILARPAIVHGRLLDYYLSSPHVMDGEGQKYIYEAFLAGFNEKTLSVLNPQGMQQDRPGSTPIQKILFNTFLAPFEKTAANEFFIWDSQWTLVPKSYRMLFFKPLQTAAYGFLGLFQLTIQIRGKKVVLTFFVESMTDENKRARKTLTKIFRRPKLWCTYTASENGSRSTITLKTMDYKPVATLMTHQQPPIIQAFKQAELMVEESKQSIEYFKQNPEVLQGAIKSLSAELIGIEKITELKLTSTAFIKNSLFPLLLEFEHYSQETWFATDFYLSFTSINEISGSSSISVVLIGSKVSRSFSFGHYASQGLVEKIPEKLHKPCVQPKSRIARGLRSLATKFTGTDYKSASKCIRHVKYSRESGLEYLSISWVAGGKLAGIKLQVQALHLPSTEMPTRDRREATLDRPALRIVDRVMKIESKTQETLSFPVVRFFVSTWIGARCTLAGTFRRERVLFQSASLKQNQMQKKAHKEQYSLKTNFLELVHKRTDPGWRFRVGVLIKQTKYDKLRTALGAKQEEFVDALANAYTTWVTLSQVAPAEASAETISEKELKDMCKNPSLVTECEKVYGVWGSLYFQEPKLPLTQQIGRKRMQAPYLFKYWKLPDDQSTARLAIGDFEDLESYKHSMGKSHQIQVLGAMQTSIAVLLSKYNQILELEEQGMDIRKDLKFQLLKYLHMQMKEVLREGSRNAETPTVASLSNSLRSAGYEVLSNLTFESVASPEDKKKHFQVVESLADLFYKDLLLPTRSMDMNILYNLQIRFHEAKIFLPFAFKLIHSNPFSMSTGFSLFPKDQRIRASCKEGFCQHPAVMWNHVYVTLLILVQLMDNPDAVAEILAANFFGDVTGQDTNKLGLQQIPLTFEESFIAFKVGLGHIMDMRDYLRNAVSFFSDPLSTETITSLLTEFADIDKDFAVLLMHLPPLKAEVALESNNRAALQESGWNALIALWSFREVFDRLTVEVSTSLAALPSFAPPSGLGVRADEGFWMPKCVIDHVRQHLNVLFGPLSKEIMKLPVVGREIDTTLHELRPVVRRTGYLSQSDKSIHSLWWKILAIALENLPDMEPQLEEFFRKPAQTKNFAKIIQEGATISAFLAQLKMADPKSVLVRAGSRFAFESWTTLIASFQHGRPSNEAITALLQRILHVACRMIPASSENQSLTILGKTTDDVVLFRSIIDAITLNLMQNGNHVPTSMTHYPICTAIKEATCDGISRDNSALTKYCNELEVVRKVILSKIEFSTEFCQAMKEAEKPLVEKCECGNDGRNSNLLFHFFMDHMKNQLESSAIKKQWASILDMQGQKHRKPKLFSLSRNALASTIHEASIRLSEIKSPSEFPAKLAEMAKEVYETMCDFVDYMIEAESLKIVNVCKTVDGLPAPLSETLSELLEAHVTRIQLARFSQEGTPIPSLSLQEILNSTTLSKSRGNAVTIGVLQFISLYFSKDQAAEKTRQTEQGYAAVRSGFGDAFKLIADQLMKLKPKMDEWLRKAINAFKVITNYVVRLVIRAAKEMTYLGKSTLVSQQVEFNEQVNMRQRLQQQQQPPSSMFQTKEKVSTKAESASGFIEADASRVPTPSLADSPSPPSPVFSSSKNASLIQTKIKHRSQPTKAHASSVPTSSVADHPSSFSNPFNSKKVSLIQTKIKHRSEPREAGKGILSLAKLLTSMMLSDITHSVSGIVPTLLPVIWFAISGVLRVKKNVVGSVKNMVDTVCTKTIDTTVLPSLMSTNSLVPADLIKRQLTMLAKSIHFSVLPESSQMEANLRAAKKDRGFFGMGILFRGLVFTVSGHLEDLLQDAQFQNNIVKSIHRIVRQLAGVIQMAFKRYRLSEILCQSLQMVLDVVADVLSEKRDDLAKFILEIIEFDALGRFSIFIESTIWRLLKLLLDGKGTAKLISDIIRQVGFMGAAKDTVKAAWGWLKNK